MFDLIQFLHDWYREGSIGQQAFKNDINDVLEREKSGYRFIAGNLAPISNKSEMTEIERAARYGERFTAVSEHIETALALYSNRTNPDYRNSIKESISSVEAATRIISNDNKATLGDALKLIDAARPMHASFKQALLKLYGYTSDQGGIRHSLLESATVGESEARFMLVVCSAFVNYFISRS